jgi:hypothetical protein
MMSSKMVCLALYLLNWIAKFVLQVWIWSNLSYTHSHLQKVIWCASKLHVCRKLKSSSIHWDNEMRRDIYTIYSSMIIFHVCLRRKHFATWNSFRNYLRIFYTCPFKFPLLNCIHILWHVIVDSFRVSTVLFV